MLLPCSTPHPPLLSWVIYPLCSTEVLLKYCTHLGQHYVIRNPITGVGGTPKWDFTSQGPYAGNPNAFVIANINSTIPAPNPANAPYLRLTQILGDLADEIYRVDTKGGQPSTTTVSINSTNTRRELMDSTVYPWVTRAHRQVHSEIL
jgi:hypothetical protein